MFRADDPDDDDPPNESYWPRFVLASVVIAAGTELAKEGIKLATDALRKRWGLEKKEESEDE